MKLTQFDPFKEFQNMQKTFEYMNRLMQSVESAPEAPAVDFVPAVNTREADDAYYIEVDLPGVKKEDINIDVKDNVLTISGERNVEEERKEDDFYRVESVYGKFERSFSLPEDVDADKIEAEAKDGVLTVKIPKAQSVDKAPKKIEIK
ncbi:Hsp20/alpha crystallin family protein [Nitratifractor sp.]|uniref:Hsp20/alpha crystallin family protein n=1 Tax=Nitratifractor sp. TaxID=2268144 RepID=UPI0025DFE22B|nr:Hsp20/alpha crystallin family protein [Nitratifractor sp.]